MASMSPMVRSQSRSNRAAAQRDDLAIAVALALQDRATQLSAYLRSRLEAALRRTKEDR